MFRRSIKAGINFVFNLEAGGEAGAAALALYKTGQYKQAEEAFKELMIQYPAQHKTAMHYLGKIAAVDFQQDNKSDPFVRR